MQTTKKHEELLVTEMFIARLNARYGTLYQAEAVASEDTRIDTRGQSVLPNEPAIDFQVTYADNGLPHEGGAVLGRKFRAHAGNIIDLTTPYDVAAAIARKQDRYGKEASEDLVLLIWKTKSCLIDPEGLGWKSESIWFKGCYFLCLPGGGTPGQIVTLKAMHGPDGMSYDL
jgi:hypothetical protein